MCKIFLTFVSFTLLSLHVSAAICESSDGSCVSEQEETSLLQVHSTIDLGTERYQEDDSEALAPPPAWVHGPIPSSGKKRKKIDELMKDCKYKKNKYSKMDVKNPFFSHGCLKKEKFLITVQQSDSITDGATGLDPEKINNYTLKGKQDDSTWVNIALSHCKGPEVDKKKGLWNSCAFVRAYPTKLDGDDANDWASDLGVLEKSGWCPTTDLGKRNLYKVKVPEGTPYASNKKVIKTGEEILIPVKLDGMVVDCKVLGKKCIEIKGEKCKNKK